MAGSRAAPIAVAAGGMALSASMAMAMVAGFEGVRHEVYLDVGGVPTWCYGATGGVVVYREYTQAECEALLAGDLLLHTTVMLRYIKVPVPPARLAALSSFTYNVGTNAFANSTLLKLLNAGDYLGACKQLLRWVKVGTKTIRGLVNRRKAEYALCIQPDEKALA